MKADIIAFKSNTILSRLIRWATKEDYTHVALMLDDNLIMETSLFGVRLRLLTDHEYPYTVLRCRSLTEEQKDQIIQYVQYSIGIGYDFKLLLGMGINILLGLNINWDDPNRYICIELISKAFLSANIRLFPNIGEGHLKPQDVFNSALLTIEKIVSRR